MKSLAQVLVGIVVVITCPLWWAAIAIGLVAYLVWEFFRLMGEGALSLGVQIRRSFSA